jgi:hypothetical protein
MFLFSRRVAAFAASVVVIGLLLSTPQTAPAQDSDSDWQTNAPAAISEKGAKPLDLSGCWSGSVEDTNYGSGTGFLFFKQSGKKAVKGTDGGLETSGPDSTGALKGKISSTSFTVSYKKGSCHVQFTGQEPSADTLTGNYTYDCSGIDTSGTFDFTFDSSGPTC